MSKTAHNLLMETIKKDKKGRAIYIMIEEKDYISESWYKYTEDGKAILVKHIEEEKPTDYIDHL